MRILAIFIALTLTSCVKNYETHGNKIKANDKAEIVIGTTSKAQLQNIAGSPSIISATGRWYYVHSRRQRVAFFKPDLVEREIIKFSFDTDDKITQMESYGIDDVVDVAYVRDTTPEATENISILRQLLRNAGRFGE